MDPTVAVLFLLYSFCPNAVIPTSTASIASSQLLKMPFLAFGPLFLTDLEWPRILYIVTHRNRTVLFALHGVTSWSTVRPLDGDSGEHCGLILTRLLKNIWKERLDILPLDTIIFYQRQLRFLHRVACLDPS